MPATPKEWTFFCQLAFILSRQVLSWKGHEGYDNKLVLSIVASRKARYVKHRHTGNLWRRLLIDWHLTELISSELISTGYDFKLKIHLRLKETTVYPMVVHECMQEVFQKYLVATLRDAQPDYFKTEYNPLTQTTNLIVQPELPLVLPFFQQYSYSLLPVIPGSTFPKKIRFLRSGNLTECTVTNPTNTITSLVPSASRSVVPRFDLLTAPTLSSLASTRDSPDTDSSTQSLDDLSGTPPKPLKSEGDQTSETLYTDLVDIISKDYEHGFPVPPNSPDSDLSSLYPPLSVDHISPLHIKPTDFDESVLDLSSSPSPQDPCQDSLSEPPDDKN